ncbi:ABC transporter substrate-binding protein [Spirochaetia bacterium]|nr:ABC transporter substrate-binding protein [Spirochaetia bacterium]
MKKQIVLIAALALVIGTMAYAGGQKNSSQQTGGGGVTELSMFVNFSWYPTESWTGIIPEEITKRTGVRFNVTRAVDGQQLGLMLASGDLPDMVYSDSLLDRLAGESVSYAYNKLIQQYTPDWKVDNMLIANARLHNQEGDDNFYFLKSAFNTPQEFKDRGHGLQLDTIIVRGDIMDELGNPPSGTLEDWANLMAMVKAKYPNLIPFTFGNWGFGSFKVAFGVPAERYGEENGKAFFHINSPYYRDYLVYMNQFYRKGYILADNYSLSHMDAEALFLNAQSFSMAGSSTNGPYTAGIQVARVVPKAYSSNALVLSPRSRYYRSSTGWAGVAITKKTRNPEAAIKFMQFMWTLEGSRLANWGREGIEWTMGSNNMPVFSKDWLDAYADSPVFDKKYNGNWQFSADAITEFDGRVAALPPVYLESYQKMMPYTYICPWLGAAQPLAGSPERDIQNKLVDMVRSAETKCVLAENDAEFNRYYNELMSNAKTIGIDRLEAYVNSRLPKYRAMYQ